MPLSKTVLQFVAFAAWQKFRDPAPVDTGNLKNNSVQLRWIGENCFEIIVNEDIAPYAKYTEYRNKSSKRWMRKSVKKTIRTIANELHGKLRYVSEGDLIDVQPQLNSGADGRENPSVAPKQSDD